MSRFERANLTHKQRDPYQMRNIYNSPEESAEVLPGVTMHKLQNRLDALTLVLKSCDGSSCRDPWRTLHPNSTVSTLRDALNSAYDEFYSSQAKVQFDHCTGGYFMSNEMPMRHYVYGNSSVPQDEAFGVDDWRLLVG